MTGRIPRQRCLSAGNADVGVEVFGGIDEAAEPSSLLGDGNDITSTSTQHPEGPLSIQLESKIILPRRSLRRTARGSDRFIGVGKISHVCDVKPMSQGGQRCQTS